MPNGIAIIISGRFKLVLHSKTQWMHDFLYTQLTKDDS